MRIEKEKKKVMLGFNVGSLDKQFPWAWYGVMNHACVLAWVSLTKGDSLENKFKDYDKDGDVEHKRGREEEWERDGDVEGGRGREDE